MKLSDILSLSFRTIKGNRLRTGLTVAIIAFGIMALIGIITATQAMNQSFKENFSVLGANAFSIRYTERNIRIGGGGNEAKKTSKTDLKVKKSNVNKVITYNQAKKFKENYNYPALVSISLSGGGGHKITYDNKETNPNVNLRGGDENYLPVSGYTIKNGRNFAATDIESDLNVCVIGHDVAEKLFGSNTDRAIDKVIKIDNIPFRVMGVLAKRGASAFLNVDNVVVTNYNAIRRYFRSGSTFFISVMVYDIIEMDAAIGEAKGAFRPLRGLNVQEADNFYIDKSDSIAEMFIRSLGFLTLSAALIGAITLFGAAIGLMNIMLVAVAERTKEIGLIKAIGGKQNTIRKQFLYESVIISLLGAGFGILLGVLVGNLFALVLGTGFVVPWIWVLAGVIICSAVGLAAGLYPAIKASKLDPIVALRYE